MTFNLMTFICRITDNMILVVSDDAFNNIQYKNYAIKIFKTIDTDNPPSRCSINIPNQGTFHYCIEQNICYLTFCDIGFNRAIAFNYLEQIYQTFQQEYNNQIYHFSRPYAAIDFNPNIKKIRRTFLNNLKSNNQNNNTQINKINQELNQTYNIMCQNINDIIKRGEKLENITNRGQQLLSDSKKFQKKTKKINLHSLYKAILPIVILILLIIALLYYKVFFLRNLKRKKEINLFIYLSLPMSR